MRATRLERGGMRRPTSLAPLNLGSSLSPLSSPDDANRPPPSLSDSGRFNFGHLQIDTQGVVPTSSRDSGYSELTDDSGAFAAGAGAGAALDFGELQSLEIIGRGASGFVRRAEHMPSGAVVAIKEITVSDETRRLQIFKEISTLLGSGDAPNLVHYHGARSYDGEPSPLLSP